MNAHARTLLLTLFATTVVTLSFARPCSAQDPRPTLQPVQLTDAHIDTAIAALIEELYDRQQPETFWDPPEWNDIHGPASQRGGYTALISFALLQAGESYQNPRLNGAIEYLTTLELEGTYAMALRTMVWAKLPPKYERYLKADTTWLLEGFSRRSSGWDYEQKPFTQYADNSIRQYAALALWEAAKRGVDIDPEFWKALEGAYLASQTPDGGWNYRDNGEPAYGSMTTAGLATLFITQDELHARASRDVRRRKLTPNELAIARGLDWMQENFRATENPGRGSLFYFYYLYGVERVGLASGYATFGGRDWYREGAAEILRQLGTWNADTTSWTVNRLLRQSDGRLEGDVRLQHLAFSLMFLSRGRAPVAINKASLSPGRWNNRPRDAANFVRALSTSTESELNWQIVSLNDDPSSWLSAPMLYLASDASLPAVGNAQNNFWTYIDEARTFAEGQANGTVALDAASPTPPDMPQLDAIRTYLERGGLLLAMGDGKRNDFGTSVEAAGRAMYPNYTWRTLDKDHWAYDLHVPVRRSYKLRALSNGVRELIILLPSGDFSGLLQDRTKKNTQHLNLGTNLYFYASEFNRPHPRLADTEAPYVRASRQPTSRPIEQARAIDVMHVKYRGNWNPEPHAWTALCAAIPANAMVDARQSHRPLSSLDDADERPDLLVLRGVDEFTLPANDMKRLATYLRDGGTVFIETVGGIGSFASALEAQLSATLESPASPIREHPIVTGSTIGGFDCTRASYRPFTWQHRASRDIAPRVRGIEVNGRIAIILSPDDCSHALLRQPCWNISGYTSETAYGLLFNVLSYVASDETPSP
ncbi:MAG: DUF4159 domain-containing protein [Planctomycetota bacterium]